jgi:hypothetical protein
MARKTARRRFPKEVLVIARNRDVSNCTVSVLQRNAFVRDVIVSIVVIPLNLAKSGKRPSKTHVLKTRKHSRIDSVWRIPKAPNLHRRSTIWVVNARSQRV